jgi:hypothetical protein
MSLGYQFLMFFSVYLIGSQQIKWLDIQEPERVITFSRIVEQKEENTVGGHQHYNAI